MTSDRTEDTAKAAREPKLRLLTVKAEGDEHPTAQAISQYLHRMRDVEFACKVFYPLSIKLVTREIEQARRDLTRSRAILDSAELNEDDTFLDSAVEVELAKTLLNVKRRVARQANAFIWETLLSSLFLRVFSVYDAFVGDLIGSLYLGRPELFTKINRNISVAELLEYESLEDIRSVVLTYEIEAFRRKSYVEQFTEMESTFGIKLRDFKHWPNFVEAAQRRNLFAHCDGIVSDQYIKICTNEGVSLADDLKTGDQLSLNPKYLLDSCSLMMEVGFKLGQTLWRKILPHELDRADGELIDMIFGFLQDENWALAIMASEFAIRLPRMSSERRKKVATINYAIALKFSGDQAGADRLLKSVDWSATSYDFRLAEAVLQDRFDEAAEFMKRIDIEGDLVREHSYHVWPLFREFRKSEQFQKAYQEVFGHPFTVELQRTTEEVATETIERLADTTANGAPTGGATENL